MRFGTKLFLWMMMLVTIVTLATLVIGQRRVAKTYERKAQQDFAAQVDEVIADRETRLEGLGRLGELAANSDAARRVAAGKNPNTKISDILARAREAQEAEKRKAPGNPPVRRPERSGPAAGAGNGGLGFAARRPSVPNQNFFTGVIREDGELINIGEAGQLQKMRRLGNNDEGSNSAVAQLASLHGESAHSQQIGYLAFEGGKGRADLREILATPILEEEKMVGCLVMGFPFEPRRGPKSAPLDPETNAGAKPTQDQLLTGLYLGGEAFGFADLGEDFPKEKVAAALREQLESSKPSMQNGIRLEAGGAEYRAFARLLNPDSIMPPAHHVTLFPLAELNAELAGVRWRAAMIGLGSLLLALIGTFFITRQLARPVQDLAEATGRIREGDLGVRVEVRSKDEIGRLGESFNEMAGELELKEQYRSVLDKVADAAIAEALIENQLELGGEERKVTVLFCDIRGFTSLVEGMPPTQIIELLNEHMTALTEVVHRNYGVVDKFVGDEIMAIFGAPKSYGNDALNAARCALEMVEVRRTLSETSGRLIEIGVGIATGDVVVGCMGSTDRLNYTVVGERVNLGSRFCSAAGPMEIVTGGETIEAIRDELPVESLGRLSLKGFAGEVEAFRLGGSQSSAARVASGQS